jgi:hypothetical protein
MIYTNLQRLARRLGAVYGKHVVARLYHTADVRRAPRHDPCNGQVSLRAMAQAHSDTCVCMYVCVCWILDVSAC